MKQKTTALLPISIILLTFLVIPVSAFYFDFQYFETDKFVYEVGETIDMVAKLIADFSDEGWCYVSFAVVTDLGPCFADEYFIPPSSAVRYLNSSFTILPEHTSPDLTGAPAFVLFTVEIFDTVSQSAGENIEITINKSHLTIIPLSQLSIQYGSNTSLPLKLASIHNTNVVYAEELVTLHVEDWNSQTVLDTNTTTSSDGIVSLNWNDTLGPPGLYNLTVSTYGNEDFLQQTESFQITVLPALSNLTVISSPELIYCQSPDGTHIEQAEFIVEHTELGLTPINNSTVQWTASFGSGELANIGNGRYSDIIPFNTSPGFYPINFTAINPQYQTEEITTVVNVEPNSLQFSTIQPIWNVTRGADVTIEYLIESTLDWNQSIQLQFIDSISQFSLTTTVQPDESSFITIPIWYNVSVGPHIVNIFSIMEHYQFSTTHHLNVTVIGTLNANVTTGTAYYGETLEFDLEVLDDNRQLVSWVEVSVFCDNTTIPIAVTGLVNPSITQNVSLPMWISAGFHNITFKISTEYFKSINYTVSIRIWMRTNITIVITSSEAESSTNNSIHDECVYLLTIRSISSGSIIRPPPILFREMTSTSPSTARSTSLDS